jgi:hypothetical protein
MNNIKLIEQVRELFSEQEEKGIIEGKIEESFKATFAQFDLESNSIKVEKIDSVKDIVTGTLKYTAIGLNINTKFVFKQKESLLALGEL